MVQDRGNIKWTTLMLPEHAEMLKELWEEDRKQRKPVLDPQEIESMNRQLMEAYLQEHTVTLSVFKNGGVMAYTGKIKRMDRGRQCLMLKREMRGEIPIRFEDVIGMTIN
jgi:hypothetical protein